jgi:hypothetical protein
MIFLTITSTIQMAAAIMARSSTMTRLTASPDGRF